MKTSPDNFKADLLKSMLDLLWRQWATLGVPGYGERESRVIDPDALLLATCVFGRYEPRMFDEMLDWLELNGWCINVQRVRSLMKQHVYGCERVVACVGAFLARGAEAAKWRRLSLCAKPVRHGENLDPMFYLADGRPQPVFGQPESHFARYGFNRGVLELRGMRQAPDPNMPGNLQFRLRALFGVNARAEIMAYLLTHQDGHPPEIAKRTGFFPKTIQMALAEMEFSGTIQSVWKGREKHYRVDRTEWPLLRSRADSDTGWPQWVAWPQFFAGMIGIWGLAQNRELAKASFGLQAAEWQKLMGRVGPLLGGCEIGVSMKNPIRLTGTAYLDAVQRELLQMLATNLPGYTATGALIPGCGS